LNSPAKSRSGWQKELADQDQKDEKKDQTDTVFGATDRSIAVSIEIGLYPYQPRS
jgi:hypothetical protein